MGESEHISRHLPGIGSSIFSRSEGEISKSCGVTLLSERTIERRACPGEATKGGLGSPKSREGRKQTSCGLEEVVV